MTHFDEQETERFAFGSNWKSFLESLDDHRIEQARQSIVESLGDVNGLRVLDLGCGSGLFSLVTHQQGARVVSIDYDHESVACTQELKGRFAKPDSEQGWQIDQGSALDDQFMRSLGSFDVVYSWGVLHHTGQMWKAIDSAANRVAPKGRLLISLYNDQGSASRRWHRIKSTYNRLPKPLRKAWVVFIAGIYECKFALARLAKLQNPLPFADWRAKREDRGMSVWHDWVDWVGGLPFEVARPDDVVERLAAKNFVLDHLKTVGNGWGCNEYRFKKTNRNEA